MELREDARHIRAQPNNSARRDLPSRGLAILTHTNPAAQRRTLITSCAIGSSRRGGCRERRARTRCACASPPLLAPTTRDAVGSSAGGGSAATLLIAGVALGVLWLSSTETRTVSSHLSASMRGIELRVRSGDVAIGAAARTEVSISRPDRCVLGHGPLERRSVRGGVLRISSGCARLVVGSCSASYRVAVPNDVPISIRIEHGTFGSTAIAASPKSLPPPARKVEDYCGFVLGAVSASGDVTVSTACSPERLTQR
jgi:hypothetical protein